MLGALEVITTKLDAFRKGGAGQSQDSYYSVVATFHLHMTAGQVAGGCSHPYLAG